jgi:hypothetical protein
MEQVHFHIHFDFHCVKKLQKDAHWTKLQFFRNDQVDFSEIPGGASGNVSRNRVHKCEDFYLLY